MTEELIRNDWDKWDFSKIYELIGHDGKVHYRRPKGHPGIKEAKQVGYRVRLMK